MKLPYDWNFRPMKSSDISDVLKIIYDFDEDDGEDAEESFQSSGVDNSFVLTYQNSVAGITGFSEAEDTEDTYWISWTYLAEEHQRQKLGTAMFSNLIDVLKKKNARKLFVSLSDYIDPDDGAVYKNAEKLYKSFGFKEEIIHRDYYAPGESEIILGYSLRLPMPLRHIDEETSGIVLMDLFEIDEADDIYAIDWEFSGTTCFTEADVWNLINKAKKIGARSIFISFPSNVFSINTPLSSSGFTPCGMLEDYFRDGLHEVHFRYDL